MGDTSISGGYSLSGYDFNTNNFDLLGSYTFDERGWTIVGFYSGAPNNATLFGVVNCFDNPPLRP